MPGKKGGTGEEGIKERRGGKKSKNTPPLSIPAYAPEQIFTKNACCVLC